MPAHSDLVISADAVRHSVELRLLDAHGAQTGYHQVELQNLSASQLQGLFDLRNFLRLYVEEGRESAAIDDIGQCIARDVLGPDIFKALWQPKSQRTLRIQLPGATADQNPLAAALARVPWEIARPGAGQATLAERNLVVRVVHDMLAEPSKPLELAPDEALRVLFVFAEARGSRPLGARQERRALQQLFEQEIYPKRRIVAHYLSHGVTRQRLRAQIQENGGYHVVHWSGHGHLNLLELARAGGTSDHLTGAELLDLFVQAGGFLPQLFFLSACHSGDILRVNDWSDFLAVAAGKEPGGAGAKLPPGSAPVKDSASTAATAEPLPGYTGTAHALLQGGVPSVVAMRYAVGDDYARALAVEFYRALLAHAQPKNAAVALTLARQTLRNSTPEEASRFAACDHATPLLYGAEKPGLALLPGVSPARESRDPRLHQIHELTSAGHPHFVGRSWELAGLGADFIGAGRGQEVIPVVVVTGLGGMGKTALVAEALALWQERFDRVLLYQSKPNPLGLEALLRDMHLKLMDEQDRYYEHVMAHRADAIYREPDADFTGSQRFERLTRNLIRALRDEPMLLVLDNFETQLKPQAEPGAAAEPLWACQDPAWDHCLAALASGLVGSASRLLITCRRPLAALAAGRASYPVRLGPLAAGEAALYLREHPALSRMVFGADTSQRALALRLLNASRFHPLLMDRLARLASSPALQPQLLQALTTLEETKNFAELPGLFAAHGGDAKELAYLGDALATSLDQLIADAPADARRLLWMIAVANEPVALKLLQAVWGGEGYALPAAPPDMAPQLSYLLSLGLATEELSGAQDDSPDLGCHELVREHIRAWMAQRPQDRAATSENAIRLAYAERLQAVFEALQDQDMSAALQAGSRALVYCVQAEAWDRLGGFASKVVTGTTDPRLLAGLIPHLQTAAESAPEGEPRWRCLAYLADALKGAGRPDASLSFYERAAGQAHALAEADGEGAQQAWADLAWIDGNWANALRNVGQLDAARQHRLDSAQAGRWAGRSEINAIASELEAFRIDIMQGQVEAALPEVEARLAQIEGWWNRHRAGDAVPEAPDAEFLSRTYMGVLDIATDAHFAQQDWPAALRRINDILEVKRVLRRPTDDIAATRMNRAIVLAEFPDRVDEAQAELELCLAVFQGDPAGSASVLSSLAALFGRQGDVAQAITQERRALAIEETLSNPAHRAISHNNLANYLECSGTPPVRAESARHQLAALAYQLVADLRQSLQTSRRNYTIRFARAHAAGTAPAIPRIADLLADPAFEPLAQWLSQRQIKPDELQAEVDDFLAQA